MDKILRLFRVQIMFQCLEDRLKGFRGMGVLHTSQEVEGTHRTENAIQVHSQLTTIKVSSLQVLSEEQMSYSVSIFHQEEMIYLATKGCKIDSNILFKIIKEVMISILCIHQEKKMQMAVEAGHLLEALGDRIAFMMNKCVIKISSSSNQHLIFTK